jgi:hypothetical protein
LKRQRNFERITLTGILILRSAFFTRVSKDAVHFHGSRRRTGQRECAARRRLLTMRSVCCGRVLQHFRSIYIAEIGPLAGAVLASALMPSIFNTLPLERRRLACFAMLQYCCSKAAT